MLGTAIVLIAIAAISAGGSAEAWIKITVAVVAGFGVVLLIFRPGRWHAEPSHQASPPAV